VNRRRILAALLAVVLAACGTQPAGEADATPTPEPTPEATAEPTDEPAASDGDGGEVGSLDDVIPDELNGVPGTTIPGMEAMMSSLLQAQGLEAGDAQFAFVTYGTEDDAIILNAFRIPGVTEVAMEQLARAMSGASAQVDAEAVTIGGKDVLSFSGASTPGVVYFYVADDVAFTIAGQNEELAEQLLSELP
jgi:hypothetical protein